MKEELEVYDLNGNFIENKERSEFYKEIKGEFKATGKITKKVKRVIVLLMNSKGRIYLQERSKDKSENQYMFDKTVGGHVSKGNTFNVTLVKECAEELGFPASIVGDGEFLSAVKNSDLRIVGIFKKIDEIDTFMSTRITKEKTEFIQPYHTAVYLGYFDGPIRFMDGESCGVKVFFLDEIKEEIKNHQEKFTDDLKYMIKRYADFLKPVPYSCTNP